MNKLSTKHLIFFFIACIPLSVRTYTSLFVSMGGKDTWICSLISAGLIIAYIYFLISTCKKYNCYNICDIYRLSLGKTLGNIAIYLFCICLFIMAVESMAVESNAIHTTIFLQTPIWYCLFFFLIPAIYVIKKEFHTILGITLLITSFSILLEVIFLFLSSRYMDISHLFPIWPISFDSNFFKCTLLILGSFSEAIIILPYLTLLNSDTDIRKNSMIGTSLGVILAILAIIGCISAFGVSRGSNIFYPNILLSERIQYGNFFEGGEALSLFTLVLGWILRYILCIYGIFIILKDKLKLNYPNIIIITLLTFGFAYFIASNTYFLFSYLAIMLYSFCILGLFIQLCVYILYRAKK